MGEVASTERAYGRQWDEISIQSCRIVDGMMMGKAGRSV